MKLEAPVSTKLSTVSDFGVEYLDVSDQLDRAAGSRFRMPTQPRRRTAKSSWWLVPSTIFLLWEGICAGNRLRFCYGKAYSLAFQLWPECSSQARASNLARPHQPRTGHAIIALGLGGEVSSGGRQWIRRSKCRIPAQSIRESERVCVASIPLYSLAFGLQVYVSGCLELAPESTRGEGK